MTDTKRSKLSSTETIETRRYDAMTDATESAPLDLPTTPMGRRARKRAINSGRLQVVAADHEAIVPEEPPADADGYDAFD